MAIKLSVQLSRKPMWFDRYETKTKCTPKNSQEMYIKSDSGTLKVDTQTQYPLHL